MAIYRSTLWLPSKQAEVFEFFSDASNLQEITPEWLDFRIVTPGPIVIRKGTLIDYRLKIHGWPMRWQSEITVWEPPHRFVDEQRRGPYRKWIHHHLFAEKDGGTEVRDEVEYAVPGGKLIERLFVRRDIEAIFAFRRKKLHLKLGNPGGQVAGKV